MDTVDGSSVCNELRDCIGYNRKGDSLFRFCDVKFHVTYCKIAATLNCYNCSLLKSSAKLFVLCHVGAFLRRISLN